jgi:glycosyltransferase involved in cell wall biosynthesis
MKIAFIGHDLKFINDGIEYFKQNTEHEIKIDQWDGHESHDEQYSLEIVEWADILFCEWGLGNVIWYQGHKKPNQKLIVRMHRFEMNTVYPNLFDYSKIDKIIAISPYVYEEFNRIANIPREAMQVVFNGVSTEKFNIRKTVKSQYNIGIIGFVPQLKRLDRAIDIFEELYKVDSRYKLYIKGKHPKEFGWVWNNKIEREYYEEVFSKIKDAPFKKNVYFDGWGDIPTWLKNIGYVLSVSDYESFHMAPIEGMSSGAFPVVLRREGVNTIFPQDYIFDSIEKASKFILENDYKNKRNLKSFVENNYSLEKMCNELEKVFIQK